MKKDIINNSIFENIKHIDFDGNEYWSARELMVALNYTEYNKFIPVIKKAINACKISNQNESDHFAHISEMVEIGSKTKRKIDNYKLSRYACYLIAQNADSRKKVVSLAQTYFAIQTRKQEMLEDELINLSEDEKRIYQRNLTKKANYSLNQTAKDAGVKNFDKFHNVGYKGLYNGECANDIAKRKNLRYRDDILDNMGSLELAANLFRITQTDDKLKRDKINGENNSCKVHYKVGKSVRKAIKEMGGTMPENLPTPKNSLKDFKKSKMLEEKMSQKDVK